MADSRVSKHGMWSSQTMFVFAAAGSAVGLGNIWRFPYIVGQNGGGAFVLTYIVCILVIGIPIMMSEVLIGRAGRQSPINTMADLAARSGVSRYWQLLGWMGALAGVLILSFYGVIAGWAIYYVVVTGAGMFVGANAETAAAAFSDLTGNIYLVLVCQSAFMLLTIVIVARGIGRGLEVTVKYLMPALFVMLVVLVGYAATTGAFAQGFAFMFDFKLDQLTWDGVLAAMGQAFFTLSLGMGAIMAYGAYMPKEASILKTVSIIAVLDTLVAIMAGLIIFPIVFANGLESSAGPGLMFITLPLAFGQMTGGQFFGCVFFILVTFAAITSSISLVEPAVAWLLEKTNISRPKGALLVGGVSWFVGLGTIFSFNIWSDVTLVAGRNFFSTLDFLTNNIMLPLGGLLIAVFAGWIMNRQIAKDELALDSELLYKGWLFLGRFIAPVAVCIVFVMAII